MCDGVDCIQWSPRVPQHKIRRLYELDAKGIIDEDLINDVAYSFSARCQDIVTVYEAQQGRVKCPRCDTVILRENSGRDELLICTECDWQVTWEAYAKTYKGQQFYAGEGAVAAFRHFVDALPHATTPRARMLQIDRVIHSFHRELKTLEANPDFKSRPTAVNLIEGRLGEVVALLDALALGPDAPPDRRARYEAWRKRCFR
jgi:ribosomal protein L37AE/L43A